MAATFWTGAGISDAFDTNAGMPGAAPLGTQMQGNPNPSQLVVPSVNIEPPAPQNSAAQGLSTQLSLGNIPHNLLPTNVAQGSGPANAGAQTGGDSLMAMMSRGQVIRGDSTYGQGGYTPSNGTLAPAQPSIVAQPTGPASGVTYSGNGNYSGM